MLYELYYQQKMSRQKPFIIYIKEKCLRKDALAFAKPTNGKSQAMVLYKINMIFLEKQATLTCTQLQLLLLATVQNFTWFF